MSFERSGTTPARNISVRLSGTVAVGDVLAPDLTTSGAQRARTFLRAATNALGNPAAAAVAMEAGVSGDDIVAQVEGICPAVNSASLTVGLVGVVDATAARLEAYVPADHNAPPFAFALGSTSSNLTEMWLYNPLGL